MKTIGWYRTALVLLVVCFAACGGCKDEGGGENNKGVPEVDEGPYRDVLVGFCKALDRCPDGLGYPIAYRSRSECIAILDFSISCRITERELGNDVSEYGVERRVPTVEANQARACADWLASADCSELLSRGDSSPCSTAFQGGGDDDNDGGSADVDEPCDGDYDCLPELYCHGGGSDADSATVYCQVCRPRLGEGEPCTQYTRECADGLGCHYVEDGPRACARPKANDERCVEGQECASEFCNYALEDLGGWGRCDPAGHIGDACSDETEANGQSGCRPEYHCDGGTCAVRRANGEPCEAGYECEVGVCEGDPAGQCGKLDGASCYDHYECTSGLCIDSVCSAGGDGACTADEQCGAGEVCSGICRPPNCSCSGGCPIGTCTPSGNVTGCEDDSDCGTGFCEDGQCSAAATLGQSCSDSYECYPVGYCSGGVCVERHDPGKSCTALDSCKEPFLCVEGRCEIMNLSCQPASAGQRCAFLRVCDDQSYCDLFDGVTCKPRASEGQTCTSSPIRGVETCRPGLSCMPNDNGQSCVKRPGIGEACSGPCVDGAYCFGGTCYAEPVGRPCGYDGPCPEGLICNSDLEVCTPRGPEGAECDNSNECAEGLYCYSYDRCQPRLGLGENCNDSQECREDLHCSRDSYSCEADLPAGAPCEERDQPCGEGFHCPSASDAVCTAQKAPGSDCSEDLECLSGLCYGRDWCALSVSCTLPD